MLLWSFKLGESGNQTSRDEMRIKVRKHLLYGRRSTHSADLCTLAVEGN